MLGPTDSGAFSAMRDSRRAQGELDFEGGRSGGIAVLGDHDRDAGAIVGDPPAGQQGVPHMTPSRRASLAVGRGRGDGLDDPAGLHPVEREQVGERGALDVGPAHRRAECRRQPDRDEGERLVVGEVEPDDTQDVGVGRESEILDDGIGRGFERELEHPTVGARAGGLERRLDGGDPAERLADRVRDDEPTRAPAALDQALVAQDLERAPYGDP